MNEYLFTGDELAKAQEFAHEFAGSDDDDIGTGIILGLMKFFGAIGAPGEAVNDNSEALEKSRAAHARLTALARLSSDPRMIPYQLDTGRGYKRADPKIFEAAARCPLSLSHEADEWNRFASANQYFSILLEISEAEGQA